MLVYCRNTHKRGLKPNRFQAKDISRKYFILWYIGNLQLGSGSGLGLGLGLGLDSVRGSTISHKMKYLLYQLAIPLIFY